MPGMGAVVTINGQRIPSTWNGSSLVALADLSITWGREDPYDLTEPGTLSLSIIDPTGDWIAAQSLAGMPITVTRTSAMLGDLIVFRGRIVSARPERRNVYNPVTKTREPVWVARLSAGDTLAEAASTVLVGEMGNGSVEGLGGWGEQGPGTRLGHVFDNGGSRVFSSYQEVPGDVLGDGTIFRRMHGQSAADQRSLLELIEQCYRTEPLGVVNYDPAANAVKVGGFAAASNIVLVYSGGTVRLQLPTGRVIDAAKVGTPEGLQAETTASDAIDVVQISFYWYGKDANLTPGAQKRVIYTNQFTQRLTRRGADSGGNRVLKVAMEVMYFDVTEFEPGYYDAQNRYVGWLRDRVTDIVNTLNGQMRLPTLRLDDRRLPLDQSTTDVLYRPYQSGSPLYFAGSAFNVLPNAGPQYQVIGGTLGYRGGWTHDLTVCPVRSSPTPVQTIAALFGTTSAAQIGQFDSSIRLGDLATVTKGL
jgi:hypothetical protein